MSESNPAIETRDVCEMLVNAALASLKRRDIAPQATRDELKQYFRDGLVKAFLAGELRGISAITGMTLAPYQPAASLDFLTGLVHHDDVDAWLDGAGALFRLDDAVVFQPELPPCEAWPKPDEVATELEPCLANGRKRAFLRALLRDSNQRPRLRAHGVLVGHSLRWNPVGVALWLDKNGYCRLSHRTIGMRVLNAFPSFREPAIFAFELDP